MEILNQFYLLPDHMDERTVCNGIAPEKDVDGFHIINIGRLCLDQHSLIPATASAVWEIIKAAAARGWKAPPPGLHRVPRIGCRAWCAEGTRVHVC